MFHRGLELGQARAIAVGVHEVVGLVRRSAELGGGLLLRVELLEFDNAVSYKKLRVSFGRFLFGLGSANPRAKPLEWPIARTGKRRGPGVQCEE